jgi:hypothetical protein
MKIGIDFDNTIVSYDSLFHKVALDQGLIPEDVYKGKAAVREYLVNAGQEDYWTQMQGLVYGERMKEATIYNGVVPFLICAKELGHECAIISHKTKHPYMGPKYDLHEAARAWISQNLLTDGEPILDRSNIFFELTKEEKLARIASFGCDFFIDDLVDILFAQSFPDGVGRILFDPDHRQTEPEPMEGLVTADSWDRITGYLKNL